MTKVTQDNRRESQQIKFFDLTGTGTRIGIDAYHYSGAPFELKTSTKANKSVSTARQVHLGKIEKWRSEYWILSQGPKTDEGIQVNEQYVAHPNNLEWFFVGCENKIRSNQERCQKVIDLAQQHGACQEDIDYITKVVEVGTRLDDPTISWKGIQESCTQLDHQDCFKARRQLDKYLKANPLKKLTYFRSSCA